jgi:hypothetical protein
MALDENDLKALGGFIRQEVTTLLDDFKTDFTQDTADATAAQAVASRDATVGKPEVDPNAGPTYYVHLADGSVIESKDSGSTHMANADGSQVAVIGRYQKGATA